MVLLSIGCLITRTYVELLVHKLETILEDNMKIFLLAAALFVCAPSFAGKIDTVKDTVKNSCKLELDDTTALELVKKAYLTCTPGSDVEVKGCKIKCLKENAGAVVGG